MRLVRSSFFLKLKNNCFVLLLEFKLRKKYLLLFNSKKKKYYY
jgi:hypothetical protein